MYWDIVKMVHLGGYQLRLTFESGETGEVDLGAFAGRSGVFTPLTNPDFFQQVYIESGVLTWPNGVDIAPETIYSMATGKPLPEWMEPDEDEFRVRNSPLL